MSMDLLAKELEQLKSLIASLEASLRRSRRCLGTRASMLRASASRVASLCLKVSDDEERKKPSPHQV